MKKVECRIIDPATEIEPFISLADLLYNQKNKTQKDPELMEIIQARHILSHYFTVYPVAVFANGKLVARAILFIYPHDEIGYIGYFESYPVPVYASLLMERLYQMAMEQKCQKLVGPVNGSFWLGYRMKTGGYENPVYFSELHNCSYYEPLWKANGFKKMAEYVSYFYGYRGLKPYKNDLANRRLSYFMDKGYTIISPNKENWNLHLDEIYTLIMSLYRHLPGFKWISLEDFRLLYADFQQIADYSFIKIAYYNQEPVAFALLYPDYKNIFTRPLHMKDYVTIFLKKIRSKKYVALYFGVERKHAGLGLAMSQIIINQLNARFSTAIGAYILKSNATTSYMTDKVVTENKYALFYRDIN